MTTAVYRLGWALVAAAAAAFASAPAYAEARRNERRPAQAASEGQRFEILRQSLLNVARNSQSQRVLLGAVFVGGTSLFAGAYIANDRLRTGEPRRLGAGVLGVAGGLSFIGGLSLWLFKTESETAPEAYLRNAGRGGPESSLEAGEALLVRLANRQRNTRMYAGGGLVALGIGDLALHFAEGSTPDTAFLVYKGAFLGTLGLALVLFPSPAELEWKAYRELTSSRNETISLRILPTPTGLALALQF